MTTEEKLDLIVKLLEETTNEFIDLAKKVEDIDYPLHNMFIEGDAHELNEMRKRLVRFERLDTLKIRLRHANNLLEKNKI